MFLTNHHPVSIRYGKLNPFSPIMGVIRKCQVFFQFLCNFFSGILGVYAKSVAFAIAWFTMLPEFSRKLYFKKECCILLCVFLMMMLLPSTMISAKATDTAEVYIPNRYITMESDTNVNPYFTLSLPKDEYSNGGPFTITAKVKMENLTAIGTEPFPRCYMKLFENGVDPNEQGVWLVNTDGWVDLKTAGGKNLTFNNLTEDSRLNFYFWYAKAKFSVADLKIFNNSGEIVYSLANDAMLTGKTNLKTLNSLLSGAQRTSKWKCGDYWGGTADTKFTITTKEYDYTPNRYIKISLTGDDATTSCIQGSVVLYRRASDFPDMVGQDLTVYGMMKVDNFAAKANSGTNQSYFTLSNITAVNRFENTGGWVPIVDADGKPPVIKSDMNIWGSWYASGDFYLADIKLVDPQGNVVYDMETDTNLGADGNITLRSSRSIWAFWSYSTTTFPAWDVGIQHSLTTLTTPVTHTLDDYRAAIYDNNEDWTGDSPYVANTIVLTPGADASKMNFAWYTSPSAETAKVQIAKRAALVDGVMPESAQIFTGTASDATLLNDTCKVTLSGLDPATEYAYRCGDGNKWSSIYYFTTRDSNNYNTILVGDIQLDKNARNAGVWEKVLNHAIAKFPNASFLMAAGDQVDIGSDELRFEYLLAPPALRSLPMIAAVGNHEGGNSFNAPNLDYHFNNPNSDKKLGATLGGCDFYFSYGNTLYMIINSNSTNNAQHEQFMAEAVASHPDAIWKIAMMHHSPYSSSIWGLSSDVLAIRDTLCPLFDAYGVDIVVGGHDHNFTRSYFMKGGQIEADQTVLDPSKEITSADAGTYVNPKGTLYMSLSTPSGSAYESLTETKGFWAATRNDLRVPQYSNMEIDDSHLTFTTYRSDTGEVIDTITIMKTPHTHTWEAGWKYDEANHWKECSCGEKNDEAAHVPSDWIIDVAASETANGSMHKECTICGYVIATEIIVATGDSKPSDSSDDGKEQSPDTGGNSKRLLCFLLGGASLTLFGLTVKRRKRYATITK